MPPLPVHMVIENGPLSGREINVIPDGIRIGRSSNNDVVIKDPALSRFHCRVFFKPNEGLWAMDLGSANQTFINDKTLTEQRIFPGDRLILGETSIKIVSDQPDGSQPQHAPDNTQPERKTLGTERLESKMPDSSSLKQDSPTSGGKTSPPAPVGFEKANLFGKPQKTTTPLDAKKTPSPFNTRFVLISALLVFLFALIIAWILNRDSPPLRPANSAHAQRIQNDGTLYIRYEKIQAGTENIFRYSLMLEHGELSIEIDDLRDNRHVPGNQLHKVDDALLRELSDTIERSGFFGGLKEEYRGLAKSVSDTLDLTIILGERAHHVRVDNSIEPDAFRSLREAIEEFGQNELGLAALALPPEKLLELSGEAYRLAQDMYSQREVKADNLWRAIRAMTEAEWYLETIEPKPDYHAIAIAKLSDYKNELQDRYEKRRFLADRSIKLKEWAEAARELRAICDEIPDHADERHDAARKKLIDVERRLFKK